MSGWEELTNSVTKMRLHSDTSRFATRLLVALVLLCLNPVVHSTGWRSARKLRFFPGQQNTGPNAFQLFSAIQTGNTALARQLVGCGCFSLETPDLINNNQRAIHIAAGVGNLAIVKALINADVNVNAKDGQGNNAVHFAAAGGHTAVLEELLDAFGNVNTGNSLGRTSLHTAALQDDPEVVELLLDAGAELEPVTFAGETPLHMAVGFGNPNVAEALVDAGADVDKGVKSGFTMQQYICSCRQAAVGFLVQNICGPGRCTSQADINEIQKILRGGTTDRSQRIGGSRNDTNFGFRPSPTNLSFDANGTESGFGSNFTANVTTLLNPSATLGTNRTETSEPALPEEKPAKRPPKKKGGNKKKDTKKTPTKSKDSKKKKKNAKDEEGGKTTLEQLKQKLAELEKAKKDRKGGRRLLRGL